MASLIPRFEAADVRRYYDRHTRAFLRYGQGGGAGVIHRAVWGPGVTTRQEAFHFVDETIAGLARSLASTTSAPLHLVDLGCGVGATLCYLAERLPAVRGTGVTLSPLQAQIAADRIRAAGLADRVACIEADYTNLRAGIAPADLAYAIESFVHGPSPERFFAECARLIRPGGLLIIVDDFLRPAARADAARRRPLLPRMARQHAAHPGRAPRHGQAGRLRARVDHGPVADARHPSRARPRDRRAGRRARLAADGRGPVRVPRRRERAAAVPGARMDRVRRRGVPQVRLKPDTTYDP